MGYGARAAGAGGLTLLATALVLVAGCTFLITFDDVPTHDAGSGDTASPPVTTSTTPSPVDSIPSPLPEASTTPSEICDGALDLTRVQGCNGFAVPNAQVCADNPAFSPYPFTSTVSRDLVVCNTPNATCVEHCANRCAHLPEGFPDECDRCQSKPDGSYCGSELGWSSKNLNLLVHCSGNALSTSAGPEACTGACVPGGAAGTARCQP